MKKFHYSIVRVFENTWFYDPHTWVQKIMRFWKEQQRPRYHYSIVFKADYDLRTGNHIILEQDPEAAFLIVKKNNLVEPGIYEARSFSAMDKTKWITEGMAFVFMNCAPEGAADNNI